MTNTVLLRKIIKDSGLKLQFIAKEMDISRYTLSMKINNESEFTTSEVEKLCEILHITSLEDKNAIFFAKEVEIDSTQEVSE